MFIAHLPAGFLLTRALQRRLKTAKYLWIGLVASVFPDIDLLYFYFVDHQRTLHHEYWTHLPIFWAAIWLAVLLVNFFVKSRKVFLVSTIFLANIFLHLILDSFAAGITWLYPFSRTSFALVTVPARYPFWIESFVFHWTFLVEIAIVVWALAMWLRERGRGAVAA